MKKMVPNDLVYSPGGSIKVVINWYVAYTFPKRGRGANLSNASSFLATFSLVLRMAKVWTGAKWMVCGDL